MIKIFLLVVGLGSVTPQVEFYFRPDTAIASRSFWIKAEPKSTPRLFEVGYCWYFRDTCPNIKADPDDVYLSSEILSHMDHRRITIKELFIIPATQYIIQDSTMAVQE